MVPRNCLHPRGVEPWTLKGANLQDQGLHRLGQPLGVSVIAFSILYFMPCNMLQQVFIWIVFSGILLWAFRDRIFISFSYSYSHSCNKSQSTTGPTSECQLRSDVGPVADCVFCRCVFCLISSLLGYWLRKLEQIKQTNIVDCLIACSRIKVGPSSQR